MPTPTITLRVPADDQPLMREVAARLKSDPVFRSNLQALVQGEAGPTSGQTPMEHLAEVVDRLASVADRLAAVPSAPRWSAGQHPTRSAARDIDPAGPDHIRFRCLREALGMRQEDAAALFERARPTIAYWENPTEGRSTVPRYALVLLELLLAVAPSGRDTVLAGDPILDIAGGMNADNEWAMPNLEPHERLRHRLALLGLRHVDLARLGQVGPEAVGHWISGRRNVPAWLWPLLDALRLLPTELRASLLERHGQ